MSAFTFFLERDLTLFVWSEIFWHSVRCPSGYPTYLFKSPQSKGGRTPPHSSGETSHDSRLPSRVVTRPNLQNHRHNLTLVTTIATNSRNYNPHSLFFGSHGLKTSKHHQGRSIRAATAVYKCGTCTKQGTWACECMRDKSGQMRDRKGMEN